MTYNNMHNNYAFLFHLLIAATHALLLSNYNHSLLTPQALLSQPTLIPLRLPSPSSPTHHPLFQSFHLRKHQLRDTDYHFEQQNLSPSDQQLIYNMEPPSEVFPLDIITIDNYRLLEIRTFPITINNPSSKFTFCIQHTLTDTEQIRRTDDRVTLPLCLPPATTYTFNFTLYVSQLNPQYLRAAVYFFIEIYDAQRLVEEKVYPRRIFASITPNHLRLESVFFRNCPTHQQLSIKNYETSDIFVRVEHKKRLFTSEGVPLDSDIRIAPTKSIKIQLEGRASQLIIHTTSMDRPSLPFPTLLLKVYCEQLLTVDYYEIGLIPDQRMVLEVPVSVSSHATHNITVEDIIVEATSQAVSLKRHAQFEGVVPPMQKNIVAAVMRVHARAKPEKTSQILVKVNYRIAEQEFSTQQRYRYCQIRHPIAVGQKRFIDVTKLKSTDPQHSTRLSQNRFPIRNNLNIPLYLVRVLYDESAFQLSWLQDRRNFIFPNHNREEFLFSYVGSNTLPTSCSKHVILLEFNGHLFVPIQIVVYDHTLQCIFEGIVYKCANLTNLDYGYFRDRKIKTKQLTIRNWNPQSKHLRISLPQHYVDLFKLNITMNIHTPIPSYDPFVRHTNHSLQLYLKGQQLVILTIQIQLQTNATSALIPLNLHTDTQNITITLQTRVQNATIALIPHVVRLRNAFTRTVEYLNLVSTFTQTYRIESLTSNLSTLSVSANNNHSDILENQWVGIVIVYDPHAPTNNRTLTSWHSLDQQISFIVHSTQNTEADTVYAKIKLLTSTELEASSTVIVENHYTPLISEALHTTSKHQYSLKRALIKRKKQTQKSHTKKTDHPKTYYELRFSLTNHYPQTLKYKVYLLSQPKFKHLSNFTQLLLPASSAEQDCFFCASQTLISRHSITPLFIKSIMRTAALPEQCHLDSKDDELFVFNSQKERIVVLNPSTLLYLLKSYSRNNRRCYYFKHSAYLFRLIQSDLPNKIMQEYNLPLFADFMRLQLAHSHSVSLFQLQHADTYSLLNEDLHTLCDRNGHLLGFRFCHTLNVNIQAVYKMNQQSQQDSLYQRRVQTERDQTYLLTSDSTHEIVLQLKDPPDSLTFYLIVANNFSQFQTYALSVELAEPKLAVLPIIEKGFNTDPKDLQLHFSYDQKQQRNRKLSKVRYLPIYVTQTDYNAVEQEVLGSRTFQLANQGDVDIVISQIGIEDREASCQHKGIRVLGLMCQQDCKQTSFVLQPDSRYNLTINFNYYLGLTNQDSVIVPLPKDLHTVNLYLYDDHGFYFKLTLVFKIIDQNIKYKLTQLNNPSENNSLMSPLTINLLSLIIVSALLFKLKSHHSSKSTGLQDESTEWLSVCRSIHRYRFRRLGKIIKQSSYSNTDSAIGSTLNKRLPRKLMQSISDDLLLSVKQVKRRQLKHFFNESQESQMSQIGVLMGGIDHHLSMSQSVSQDHEDHDSSPLHNDKIIELVDISKEEHDSGEQQDAVSESEKVAGSELPEGEQVDLPEVQEDSWYDFNSEINSLANKSNSNTDLSEDEFYNVFKCEMGLKELKHRPKYQ